MIKYRKKEDGHKMGNVDKKVNKPSLSSVKSKSKAFLIDLKKLVTAPPGTSSREPMLTSLI